LFDETDRLTSEGLYKVVQRIARDSIVYGRESTVEDSIAILVRELGFVGDGRQPRIGKVEGKLLRRFGMFFDRVGGLLEAITGRKRKTITDAAGLRTIMGVKSNAFNDAQKLWRLKGHGKT